MAAVTLLVTQPCWSKSGSSLTLLATHVAGFYRSYRSSSARSCPIYIPSTMPKKQSNAATMARQPNPLPSNFLAAPPPKERTKNIVDLSAVLGREYANSYAAVIDNAFTRTECNQLLKAAEARNGGKWEQAMINTGNYQQELMTDIRDCGRIIWDDRDMVAKLWSRVADLIPEVQTIDNKPGITGWGPVKRKETLRMTRLNERMRFLKYGEGQYFRPHFDGSFRVPGGDETSFYTLHLYLNGVGDESEEGKGKLEGGATTFHSDDGRTPDFDVDPKVGRILVFQHRGLMHSGADVLGGIKYTLRTDLMFRNQDRVHAERGKHFEHGDYLKEKGER